MNRRGSLSKLIYAGLIRLYPANPHRLFGDELQQVFHAKLANPRQFGHKTATSIWINELFELPVNVLTEYLVLANPQMKGTLAMSANQRSRMFALSVLFPIMLAIVLSLVVRWHSVHHRPGLVDRRQLCAPAGIERLAGIETQSLASRAAPSDNPYSHLADLVRPAIDPRWSGSPRRLHQRPNHSLNHRLHPHRPGLCRGRPLHPRLSIPKGFGKPLGSS